MFLLMFVVNSRLDRIMPKEIAQLVGQPLGWDMFDIREEDGFRVIIERAVSISDLCTQHCANNADDFDGKVTALLCFYKDHKHGPVVAYLEILDLEKYILSEKVNIHMTRVEWILNGDKMGKLFLSYIPLDDRDEGVQQIIDLL